MKWTSELLECDDCCYSYRSVHPANLYKLECPNCGNISKHNRIFDTNVKYQDSNYKITVKEAIHILKMHNEWRKGSEEIEMIHPKLLGECIECVVDYFEDK